MTTEELIQELRKRIVDGRITNIEGHLRRNNKTRPAATNELRDATKWEHIPIYGKYGAIYVKLD